VHPELDDIVVSMRNMFNALLAVSIPDLRLKGSRGDLANRTARQNIIRGGELSALVPLSHLSHLTKSILSD
jgi:hypothetical protein